jgi:hypothetical protein
MRLPVPTRALERILRQEGGPAAGGALERVVIGPEAIEVHGRQGAGTTVARWAPRSALGRGLLLVAAPSLRVQLAHAAKGSPRPRLRLHPSGLPYSLDAALTLLRRALAGKDARRTGVGNTPTAPDP